MIAVVLIGKNVTEGTQTGRLHTALTEGAITLCEVVAAAALRWAKALEIYEKKRRGKNIE